MARIDDLNSRMNRLQNNKIALGKELEKYHKRKGEVKAVIAGIEKARDGSYKRVNGHSDKTAENTLAALIGIVSIKSVVNQIIADKEKASDSKVASALSELKSEMVRIQNKIDSLSTELSSINTQLRDTRSDIREEKKRMAEEA